MADVRTIKVANVKVTGRYRKDMGDIESLAASIEKNGLLQPIVVRPDMTLVCGERRLRAVQHLQKKSINAHVVDGFDDAIALIEAERDENTERKDLTPSEKVALGVALEDLEKPKAKERMKDAGSIGGKSKGSETFTDPSKGNTRDKVGKALGISGPTYERAKRVVEEAESDPERFGDLVEKMDRTGKVSGSYHEMLDRKHGGNRAQNRGQNIAAESNAKRHEVRAAQIRELAGGGHVAAQIAEKLGLTTQTIRATASRAKITLPDAAIGKRKKFDPNRIVAETVSALEGMAMGVGLIENVTDGYDMERLPAWVESMSQSLRSLSKLHKRLKEVAGVNKQE